MRLRFASAQLLARSPADFARCKDIFLSGRRDRKSSHFFITNNGLQIRLILLRRDSTCSTGLAQLNCTKLTKLDGLTLPAGQFNAQVIAVPLTPTSDEQDVFWRPRGGRLVLVPTHWFDNISAEAIYIKKGSHLSFMPDQDFALNLHSSMRTASSIW
jgi:hypothetical protein